MLAAHRDVICSAAHIGSRTVPTLRKVRVIVDNAKERRVNLKGRPPRKCARSDSTLVTAKPSGPAKHSTSEINQDSTQYSGVTYQTSREARKRGPSGELAPERCLLESVHHVWQWWLAYPATRSSKSQTELRSPKCGDELCYGRAAVRATGRREPAGLATAQSSEWLPCQRPPVLKTDRTARRVASPISERQLRRVGQQGGQPPAKGRDPSSRATTQCSAAIRSYPPQSARIERRQTLIQHENSKQEGS